MTDFSAFFGFDHSRISLRQPKKNGKYRKNSFAEAEFQCGLKYFKPTGDEPLYWSNIRLTSCAQWVEMFHILHTH